jgi:hypothetical protein
MLEITSHEFIFRVKVYCLSINQVELEFQYNLNNWNEKKIIMNLKIDKLRKSLRPSISNSDWFS